MLHGGFMKISEALESRPNNLLHAFLGRAHAILTGGRPHHIVTWPQEMKRQNRKKTGPEENLSFRNPTRLDPDSMARCSRRMGRSRERPFEET